MIDMDPQINESIFDINALPNEVLLKFFGYLTQNQLGQIARLCRRWNELIKSPALWKKVDVKFSSSHVSQTTVAKSLINNLPICVTYLRLNFIDRWLWSERLKFEEFAMTLNERCPHLKVLILEEAALTHSFPFIINLCCLFLHEVQTLIFRFCEFSYSLGRPEIDNVSKIEILDVNFCEIGLSSKPLFSNLPNLKQLRLNGTANTDSWFHDDISFLNQVQALDLGGIRTNSRIFRVIRNHGLNLKELYLCFAFLLDNDFNFGNSVFPLLERVCLSCCSRVTCKGVISLIQSCPSLQDVYVDEDVADSYAAHPSVINKCKAGIVKSISTDHTHTYLFKD